VTGSGLSDAPLTFYIRRATKDLWKHLSAKKTPISFITGSPGIGKSLEVYVYAMRQASAHGHRVLYIHSSQGINFNLVSADGNGVRFGYMEVEDAQRLRHVLLSAMKQKSVDLIVLDGRLADLIYFAFATLSRYPDVRLITCTSFQAISVNTEQKQRSPKYLTYIVDSWTLEELESAVDKKALVLDPSVGDVERAYYYAGGSARMLQWSVESIIDSLDGKIRELSNLSLTLLWGQVAMGDASSGAKNTLMSFIDGVSTVSSSYVVDNIAKKLSASDMKTLRDRIPNDRSWLGKIAELEVFEIVKKQTAISFRDMSGSIETWRRRSDDGHLQKFMDDKDPCFLDPSVDWYWPSNVNEGCFDAIYRVHHPVQP